MSFGKQVDTLQLETMFRNYELYSEDADSIKLELIYLIVAVPYTNLLCIIKSYMNRKNFSTSIASMAPQSAKIKFMCQD